MKIHNVHIGGYRNWIEDGSHADTVQVDGRIAHCHPPITIKQLANNLDRPVDDVCKMFGATQHTQIRGVRWFS